MDLTSLASDSASVSQPIKYALSAAIAFWIAVSCSACGARIGDSYVGTPSFVRELNDSLRIQHGSQPMSLHTPQEKEQLQKTVRSWGYEK
jgi:hypothetical protein